MSETPLLAIVLEGGLVQWLITESWPTHLPPPRVVIVDYDTEGAGDDEVARFAIGDEQVAAVCRAATPVACESYDNFLSPKAVLAAMGEPVESNHAASPLALARALRSRIRALDAELDRDKRAPTSDDYNRLLAIVSGWLIDILQALRADPD